MCKVYTARINYTGLDGVNTTVKDNPMHVLSPNWNMVSAHKAGRISNAEYTEQYTALLRKRYLTRKAEFLAILKQETVTLTCYCGHDAFCHRRLAVEILNKIAINEGIGFDFGGEKYGVSGEYTYSNSHIIQRQFGKLVK